MSAPLLTRRPLTLAERYPNTKPRLMCPETLLKEGKAILCCGRAMGEFVPIWTRDGNSIVEMHIIHSRHLPPKDP